MGEHDDDDDCVLDDDHGGGISRWCDPWCRFAHHHRVLHCESRHGQDHPRLRVVHLLLPLGKRRRYASLDGHCAILLAKFEVTSCVVHEHPLPIMTFMHAWVGGWCVAWNMVKPPRWTWPPPFLKS